MARQVSSRLEGVCKEYFLKMTNTIKKFAVTAKGDKTALIIPVSRLLVLRCSTLSNSASGRWKQELPNGYTVKVAVVLLKLSEVEFKYSISFKPGASSNASPTHFAYWTLKQIVRWLNNYKPYFLCFNTQNLDAIKIAISRSKYVSVILMNKTYNLYFRA